MGPQGQAGLAQAWGGEGYLQREQNLGGPRSFKTPTPPRSPVAGLQSLCWKKVRIKVTASGGGGAVLGDRHLEGVVGGWPGSFPSL